MKNKQDNPPAWPFRLRLPIGLKMWVLKHIVAIIDHFLKSEPYREALRDVVKRNEYQVREILDIWDAPGEPRKAAGKDYTDKKDIEEIVLSSRLSREQDARIPECSIVIPVFNKDYLTYRCLKSLMLAGIKAAFEVIVVDNGSSDNTQDVLDYFGKRVRVIVNRENLGFVAACNQGAQAAKGDFLVFLNNDTEVSGEWLDMLLGTAKDFDKVGAVGAKLVYPDGTLQEAGGIIFNNGSGANYGKGGDPNEVIYNFLREVDYCSGACLMVRKDLFNRLGGFDARYAPAFYEDTDLCFGIRQIGYKVMYQPLCEVTHYEGATAGTNINAGYKRYQEINREKFVEKWKDELALQKAPSSNLYSAADRRTGPSILVIDWQLPKYDQDSGSLRMFLILKLLSQMGCRVSFMLRWDAPLDFYGRAVGGLGVRLIKEVDIFHELSSGVYDLVILSRLDIANTYWDKVKRATPAVPVVFDTVDLNFVREMRMAELTGDKEAAKTALAHKEIELGLAARMDLTIAITDADKEHLLKENPALKVEVVPNIHQPLNIVPSTDGRSAFMFIGGFAHPPNVDAMLYFVNDILPLVRRELGEVEFLIVGSFPPPEIQKLASDSIIVTGYVPDTAPYFRKSRVLVSPLRYGSGMKGKIGESLVHGVPVVTTSVGAEGMELVHGVNAMIKDDPVAFAADVVSLYKDDGLWMRLAVQGQKHVAEHFGPQNAREKLARMLSHTLGSKYNSAEA